MAHCWEEYMWKVHKAVPVDPWASNVQLLDVLIEENTTTILWLPRWLHKQKASSLSRAGSMLILGSKPIKVVTKPIGGDVIGNKQLDSKTAATLVQPVDKNINIGDANGDLRHPAPQPIKSGSDDPLLNKNTPNGDTTGGPAHVVNDVTTPAQCQHIHKNSDGSMELNIHKILSSMPDIQASINSSTSLLASITGGTSASAQFDVKGSSTVTCNVGGVKSERVDVDALMELVTPSTSRGSADLWQPDTSLPQLQWHCKRGQTLLVVTEIMYAHSITIKGDNQAKASGSVKVTKGGLEGKDEIDVEKGGLWTVIAAKDNPTFPFALRFQRLKYDAHGRLHVSTTNKPLKRNNSLNPRSIASKHVDASSSLSRSRTTRPSVH